MSEETPMLYGVEINEPYQVNAEYKFRCFLQVSDDYDMSWCQEPDPDSDKPDRRFCTPHEEAAEQIAGFLAESWDAKVVPVEGGIERDDDIHAVVRSFAERAKYAARQRREIR